MESSKLDRRVTIEQNTPTRDGNFGSNVAAWSTYTTVWAAIDEKLDIKLGGAEKVENAERILVRPVRVRIRYSSVAAAITTAMRVNLLDRGRILQIVSIAEVGRRDAIDLMCEAYSV